ncbi:hypothetical protein C8R46DRAFT_1085049 [Mycena filopes]|nr:hypothetical protein C8R46DRAFT_1085049 [Mycena filopes]
MQIRPASSPSPLAETSYPAFTPHITLASLPHPEPSLATILSAIPDTQHALPITFDAVAVGDHFFRSVFLAVRPTAALRDLHQHVHAKLGIPEKTPKYPHISLCYINDEDAAAGERMRYFEALEQSGRIRKDGDSVSPKFGWLDAKGLWRPGR